MSDKGEHFDNCASKRVQQTNRLLTPAPPTITSRLALRAVFQNFFRVVITVRGAGVYASQPASG